MQRPALGRHRLLASVRPASGTGRCWRAHVFVPPCRVSRQCLGTLPTAETKVERILLDTIKATGPISFATYMQMCLSHPTAGYYMNPSNPVLGARGDFTTSPEISQVFGELVGVWLLSQWMVAGNTRSIRLVELGPGRGTLMQDVLRVMSQFPAARTAVSEIHLIETSLAMQEHQKTKLGASAEANAWSLSWHGSIDDIQHDPAKFTLIIAHEFFDALPFHLVQKTVEGWKEIMITSCHDPPAPTTGILSPTGQPSSSRDFTAAAPAATPQTRFREVLSRTPTASSSVLGASSPRFQNLPVGSRIEVSPVAFKIARKVGELVHTEDEEQPGSAGSALIVDYGGDKAYGSSFRAFKDHRIVGVFHRPGECDLTTNVDFEYLKEAIADLAVPHGPLPQATFLTRMGLEVRVDALRRAAQSEDRKSEIAKAAQRLVDRTGMGTQYQVMAVSGTRRAPATPAETWPFVHLDGER